MIALLIIEIAQIDRRK